MRSIEERKQTLQSSIETALEYSEGELTEQIKNSSGEEQKELVLKQTRLMRDTINKLKKLEKLILIK